MRCRLLDWRARAWLPGVCVCVLLALLYELPNGASVRRYFHLDQISVSKEISR